MKSAMRLLALGALAFGQQAVAAPTYSSLYVFGDSLVDAGNAALFTGGVEANPNDGYAGGRFSNGPNFADYLSALVTPQPLTVPALLTGLNYAVGGADAQTKAGARSPSFQQQFTQYYVPFTRNAPIASDALVLVTFGGNDVRDTINVGGAIDYTQASADFVKGLDLLYAQGARNFVITGSPDIGLLPRSVEDTKGDQTRLDELTARSQQISALFAADTAALDAKAGVNAVFFDLFDYEHRLIANPAAFGLPMGLNTTTPCQVLGGGVPQLGACANALYFDKIHPTTTVHQAIAGAIVGQLAASVPEPATWTIMIIGFAAIGVTMRHSRRAMLPA